MDKFCIDHSSKPYFNVDEHAGEGIFRIAGKVAKDFEGVLGFLPEVKQKSLPGRQEIFVLNLEKAKNPEGILQEEILKLQGKREVFSIGLSPKETGERLHIIGSDTPGTIYGLFYLSELLGVAPGIFFADLVYTKRDKLVFSADEAAPGEVKLPYRSKEPSVRYRGFFINDEWPCFGNWTFEHFGDFTAQMYEHIFEYLLRLKGNYLWPAMWTSSFMADGPGMASMELADLYGISIGMSHHEQCMRSGEEYSKLRGANSPYGDAWDYRINPEGLLKFWEDGIIRSIGHKCIPTLGMRGERDSKMLEEGATIADNVRLLKEIIAKQRAMVQKHMDAEGRKTPTVFAIYKEVEEYYFGDPSGEGLQGYSELEDSILLFCEDNFGNLRAIPKKDQKHPGGYGMYYHLDYHGDPISYEWTASTPITKIAEQMETAYAADIRSLWILNVGDVKFQEYPLQFFMEMAYDMEGFSARKEGLFAEYTSRWIRGIFGKELAERFQDEFLALLGDIQYLTTIRKQEAMNSEVFHPTRYKETGRMIEFCEKIIKRDELLYARMKEEGRGDTYFSVLHYWISGTANLFLMHLYATLNHLFAKQGKAVANVYARKVDEAIQSDKELCRQMEGFKEGKWKGMELASHIGFINWNDEDWRYPLKHVLTLPRKKRLIVSKEDDEKSFSHQYFPTDLEITDFRDSGNTRVKLQIAAGGDQAVDWKITDEAFDVPECPWLILSSFSGETSLQTEVELCFDACAMLKEEDSVRLYIRCDEQFVPVLIHARKSKQKEGYIEENGIISMLASDYTRAGRGEKAGQSFAYEKLPNYGKYSTGMKVYPLLENFEITENAPFLEYSFTVGQAGEYILCFCTAPSNPISYEGESALFWQLDQEEKQRQLICSKSYRGGDGNCKAWRDAVLNAEHRSSTRCRLSKGEHRLRIFANTPEVILEKIMITMQENALDAYLGAPSQGGR